ncbi:hypothetical protein [uncultured Capnocytophaga sp.]|uniref:hypothetical protein n=1 Tax=uncultured Capnocytophaga sp. TaxID=159273 RepID=UPI002607838A|nr:hypothetical protein [uncultured Capnocytophaga sp.]
MCFGDVAAGESVLAKIGSTSLKALQFCDRIGDPFRYMGISIRYIKNASGKLLIVFRNATGKVAERLESGLYRVRVLVNNTERLEDVSEDVAEELFNGRTAPIGGDTNARLAHTAEDTAEKTAKIDIGKWLKSLRTKINPRKDLPDGKFEKYVTGDDIQYEIVGGNEKIWADGIKIKENKVIDAKHNPGNFYTKESYDKKTFLYRDLENEFKRYAAVINDPSTPVDELLIYISKENNDSVKLFEYLGKKFNVKTKVILEKWNE